MKKKSMKNSAINHPIAITSAVVATGVTVAAACLYKSYLKKNKSKVSLEINQSHLPTYAINQKTQIYHKPSCNQISTSDEVVHKTTSMLEKEGYHPCEKCFSKEVI